MRAVQELNDSLLEGRHILVREDREDRDVKGESERPPRARGRMDRGGRDMGPRGRVRGRMGPRGGRPSVGRGREGQPSGFQVRVRTCRQ